MTGPTIVSATLILALGMVGGTLVVAAPLPQTFEEAVAQSDIQESELSDYYESKFMPYFGPRYADIINKCLATITPSEASLSFVIAIDEAGKAIKIYRNGDVSLFRCVEPKLLGDLFPVPPTSPAFSRFKIDFPADLRRK